MNEPRIITFDQWAAYHATMFGMTGEGQLSMVLAWEHAFAAAGFTIPELADASRWMASHSAPRGQWDHLPLIQQRIYGQRAAVAERHRAKIQEDDFGRCVLCDNAAFVVVPHLRFVVNGEWLTPFPTFAVACRCVLGRKAHDNEQLIAANNKRAKVTLMLIDYEPKNPDWQKQLTQRAAAVREFAKAQNVGTPADVDIENLRKRLAAKFGLKGMA